METQTLMRLLDLAGIGVFALSGALMAVRLRQTLVTAAFFALVTGVGGGSARDLLIGAPVFWVQDGANAAVCLAIALVDRKRVVEGKSVSVRVDLGGGRTIQKKKKINKNEN